MRCIHDFTGGRKAMGPVAVGMGAAQGLEKARGGWEDDGVSRAKGLGLLDGAGRTKDLPSRPGVTQATQHQPRELQTGPTPG